MIVGEVPVTVFAVAVKVSPTTLFPVIDALSIVGAGIIVNLKTTSPVPPAPPVLFNV